MVFRTDHGLRLVRVGHRQCPGCSRLRIGNLSARSTSRVLISAALKSRALTDPLQSRLVGMLLVLILAGASRRLRVNTLRVYGIEILDSSLIWRLASLFVVFSQ
ncbi:hypothetical protein FKP32DRAFT_1187331 [Trametes sanguinea]|nr:hypothetical protein FKP32DRAFT_1187331 [Trametes sanguinea]